MVEENTPECDVSDMVCQMQVLAHLRGMKEVLGEDRFNQELPEFAKLSKNLDEQISTRELNLEEAMKGCGLVIESDPAPPSESMPDQEE